MASEQFEQERLATDHGHGLTDNTQLEFNQCAKAPHSMVRLAGSHPKRRVANEGWTALLKPTDLTVVAVNCAP